MTLDELDRLAAEKVMGWSLQHGVWHDMAQPEPTWKMVIDYWRPTRYIAQAWECLENLRASGYCCINVEFKEGDGWCIWLRHLSSSHGEGGFDVVMGDPCHPFTAPEAIVRACLKAKGVEID
jgi:hypothetical protein